MKTIGERLIELREANNLTRIELAKKLEVNKSTITRYETNEIKPNLDMLIKIAQMFDVTLDSLAGITIEVQRNDKDKQMKRLSKYAELLGDCEKYNISPEKLKKAIDLLKD